MADWVGFTDADLERMKNGSPQKKLKQPRMENKTVQRKASKSGSSIKRSSQKVKQEVTAKPTDCGNLSGALLLQPAKNKNEEKKIEEKTTAESKPIEDKQVSIVPEKNILLEDEEIREKEKLKLEEVHLRQKQMEEKNRKKKALLAKEIAERKKKAFAESHKLIKIQDELGKLDQMLNIDVSILRDKIEEACFDFANAQKRFVKAEAEYVESKMDLHRKTMKKEDLTEHLYHMIQANEERKAKKLEDLMCKLDVEESFLEKLDQVEANESATAKNDDKVTVAKQPEEDCNPSSEQDPVKMKLDENSESLHGANA